MAWPQTFVQTVAAIASAAGFHLAFTRLSSASQPTEPSARGRGGTGGVAWRTACFLYGSKNRTPGEQIAGGQPFQQFRTK